MPALNLNFQRRLFFSLILLLGLSYLYFFWLLFHQVLSAFLMQFIFLLDHFLHSPGSLFSFFFSEEFLVNFSAGLFLFYLTFIFLRGLFLSFKSFLQTRHFLRSLPLTKKKNYYLFDHPSSLAFTAGYFRPQIYISSRSLATLSPSEFQAVLLHEQEHAHSFDPLKDFLISLINNIIPVFPFKSYLFAHYAALDEIACDQHALKELSSVRPLVSALLKSSSPSSLNLSHFSAQKHRFQVLLGQKSLLMNRAVTFNALLVAVFFFLSLTLTRSNPFYSCSHLLECLRLVSSPAGESSVNLTSTSSGFSGTLSSHCQQ